jgi:hypothetical protein
MKVVWEEWNLTYKGKTIWMTADFSSATVSLQDVDNIFKCWNKRTVNPESYIKRKHNSEMKKEIRHSHLKEN